MLYRNDAFTKNGQDTLEVRVFRGVTGGVQDGDFLRAPALLPFRGTPPFDKKKHAHIQKEIAIPRKGPHPETSLRAPTTSVTPLLYWRIFTGQSRKFFFYIFTSFLTSALILTISLVHFWRWTPKKLFLSTKFPFFFLFNIRLYLKNLFLLSSRGRKGTMTSLWRHFGDFGHGFFRDFRTKECSHSSSARQHLPSFLLAYGLI